MSPSDLGIPDSLEPLSSTRQPVGFFSGLSHVKITGGEFNEVRGDYFVYDQSRQHSTVNTMNRTILNSRNNNSIFYRECERCLTSPILADLRCD